MLTGLLIAAALAPLVQGAALQPPWRVATLPKQTLPVTQYSVEVVDGVSALRVQAQGSYGNYVLDLPGVAAPRLLKWDWRMQQANAAVDLRNKAGDDAALKVCLSFDLPLQQVPFFERQLLRLARSQSGQDLPAATLCWVWGHAEKKGELLPNAYSARVRYIVLRNAQDARATWLHEQRDVTADFRRAFGEESAQLPPLTAVIVAGDADNTGGASLAHVAQLRGEP